MPTYGKFRRRHTVSSEIAEMRRSLIAYGYNPKHATTLNAEGMGPFELRETLTNPPGTFGSLTVTHGFKWPDVPRRARPDRCTCRGGFGDGCRSNGCAYDCPVCRW